MPAGFDPTLASLMADGLERIAAEDSAEDARRAARDSARHDLAALMEFAGQDETGAPLAHNGYTRLLSSILQHCYTIGRHVSHVAPQGLGKSTVARWLALHALGNKPETRCVAISGEADVAEASVNLCREIIMTDRFRAVFPLVVPDAERSQYEPRRGSVRRGWRQDMFFLRTDGQSPDPAMAAVATRGRAENRRVDLLLADDVMTQVNAESQKIRESYCRTIKQKWLNGRLKLSGTMIAIQNCWHEEDLAHLLLRDERVTSIWIGVTPDCETMFVRIKNPPRDKPLPCLEYPEAFGLESVPISSFADVWQQGDCAEFEMPLPANVPEYSRAELRWFARNDPANFTLSCGLVALSDADRMVQHWSERHTPAATVADLLGLEREHNGLPVFSELDLQRYILAYGIDLSSMRKAGTGFWVVAKNGEGIIFPVYHARGVWDIERLVAEIEFAYSTLNLRPAAIVCETNAVQDQIERVVKVLARQRDYDWWRFVVPHITGRKKSDPQLGLPGINALITNHALHWPRDESKRKYAHAENWRLFEAEVSNCPRMIDRGQTPDGLMMFWQALQYLQDKVGRPGRRKSMVRVAPAAPRDRVLAGY